MKDKLVTVFGGSGFLGRYVIQRLAQEGAIVRVAVRNPDQALFLKTMGQVGQIIPVQVNIYNARNIEQIIDDSDYVVNLVGILYEKGRNTFERVHVKAAKDIAYACQKKGVERLVHISAIGADSDSESKYASTKGRGEEEVIKSYPKATILRPSVMFGEEDQFFNTFACLARVSPSLPLIDGGKTLFQPVYVDDVAKAVYLALSQTTDGKDPFAGKVYELGGPKVYSFKQILEYILELTNRQRLLLPVPFSFATLMSYFTQLFPSPLLTPDQVKLLKRDNVVSSGILSFKNLGIEPVPVESIVPIYLKRYRYHG